MAELCKHSVVLQHFMVSHSADIHAFQNSLYLFTIQFFFLPAVSSTPFIFKTVHIPVLFETQAQIYLTVRPHSDVMYGVK